MPYSKCYLSQLFDEYKCSLCKTRYKVHWMMGKDFPCCGKYVMSGMLENTQSTKKIGIDKKKKQQKKKLEIIKIKKQKKIDKYIEKIKNLENKVIKYKEIIRKIEEKKPLQNN